MPGHVTLVEVAWTASRSGVLSQERPRPILLCHSTKNKSPEFSGGLIFPEKDTFAVLLQNCPNRELHYILMSIL